MQRRTVIRIATRRFSASGISFRYPATWRASPKAWRWTSSVTSLVTYLATSPLHDPCARTATTISCSSPLAVLVPGGVLVSFTRSSMAGWTLAKQPGRATTLAGRPARLRVARPGACRALGATETVTAQIALAARGSSLQMQACLRGSTPANGKRVMAMLGTLRVA